MNPHAEHLEKQLLAARKEIEELRKRVCVPEGWCVVPVEPSAGHLDSMAMRMRHDFGLLPEYLKERFRGDARQLYEECTGQGFYKLAAPTPVQRVEQEAVAMLLIDDASAEESGEWDIEPITAVIEKLARSGGATLPLYTTPQPAAPAAQDVAELVEALEAIADPITALHKRLAPGEKLDGAMAVTLTADPWHYRKIAIDALATHQSGGAK